MERKFLTLDELSEPVRAFLAEAGEQNGLVIRDRDGRTCFNVIPWRQASASEREEAWREIRAIQENVAERMRLHNITEDDLDRALREDD